MTRSFCVSAPVGAVRASHVECDHQTHAQVGRPVHEFSETRQSVPQGTFQNVLRASLNKTFPSFLRFNVLIAAMCRTKCKPQCL